MAGRFSYSSGGTQLNDPWFRIGNFDVGSAGLLAVASAVTMVLGAFAPALLRVLALIPGSVRSGEVWRLITWPLASEVNIWTVISIALLWVFGNMLEARVGRVRMATLLGVVIIVTGLIGTGLNVGTAGIDAVEFVIILIFIAEHPKQPFFFGIPGWVLGVVFVALQVLSLIQYRRERELILFLSTLVIGALMGRAVGLLNAYDFIPRIPLPASLSGQRRKPVTRQSSGSPVRNHRGKVLDGPWSPPTANPSDQRIADQGELDALLDKISATGLDSLTGAEKKRLNELSKKLR